MNGLVSDPGMHRIQRRSKKETKHQSRDKAGNGCILITGRIQDGEHAEMGPIATFVRSVD